MKLRTPFFCLFAICALGLVSAATGQEQTREELTEEAEALFEGLEKGLKANPVAPVTTDNVPGYVTDEPTQTEYYDNDARIENDAVTRSYTDPTALTVRDSMERRPGVTAAELEEWTANGMAIEGNAQSIVTEYGGAYGDCTTEITSGTEDTTFIYTCDEGETIQETVKACEIPLVVSVDPGPASYIYRATLFHNVGDCAFEPDPAFLTIQSSGVACTFRPVGGGYCGGGGQITRCGGNCSDQIFEATCAAEVPGLTPIRVERADPVVTEDVDEAACATLGSDANCVAQPDVCIEGPETRVINGVEVTRDCWKWSRRFDCVGLGGAVTDCDPPSDTCQLTSSTCLSTDDATGECRTTEHMYECTVPGSEGGAVGYCEEDVYCISGDCQTIVREQNDEFHDAVSALGLLGELQNDTDAENLEIFPGDNLNCDKSIFGLKNCCSVDGFLVSIFGCNAEEEELKARQEEGQCHYVGTFCAKKGIFGICRKKRRSFCCFNNKLARIVHEQGRPQIPREFGEPKEPDCTGFTVAQFQSLDLSTVDFSEFYDDVLAEFQGPDPDGTAASITQRILDTYACPPNC